MVSALHVAFALIALCLYSAANPIAGALPTLLGAKKPGTTAKSGATGVTRSNSLKKTDTTARSGAAGVTRSKTTTGAKGPKSPAAHGGAASGTAKKTTTIFTIRSDCPTIDIHVGPQKTLMNVMFDTGSVETWVRSNLCRTGRNCGDHFREIEVPAKYNSMQDVDQVEGDSVNEYGDKLKVTCIPILMELDVAGIQVPGQKICAARKISERPPFDIAAMAGVGHAKTKETNIFNGLMKQFPANSRIIGLWYDPEHITSKSVIHFGVSIKPGGEITYGGVDNTKFTGKMLWAPVLPGFHYWSVKVKAIKFGTVTVAGSSSKFWGALKKSPPMQALMDTGATRSRLSPTIAQKIFDIAGKALGMQPGKFSVQHKFDCKLADKLPSLEIALQTMTLVVPNEFLYRKDSQVLCEFMIDKSAREGHNVFASNVLRAFYVGLDLGMDKIGFATMSTGPYKGTVKGKSLF